MATKNNTSIFLNRRDYEKNSPFFVFLVFSCFIFAFFPVWKGLITTWYHSEDYSHAFLIVPVCLYLVWDKRKELSLLPTKASWLGLVIVICASAVYLFAYAAGITTLASFTLIVTMIGIVLGLFGTKITKRLTFPLFLLFLMIPIPTQIYYAITTPLQLLVSQAAVFITSLLNIPIYLEGNVIHLPQHTLQVVAACSGMRSIIALTTLSLIYSHISLTKNTLRTILVLAAVPVAIIINIVRVISMILSFFYFNYDLTHGNPHTSLGVFVFILALLIIFLFQKLLSRLER